MSSSTSSSERAAPPAPAPARAPARRHAGLVAACLVLMLLALEVGLRVLEPRLSLDIQHIRSVPAVAEAIRTADEPRVLFLGNSLTRNGIDLEVVGSSLEAADASGAALFALYPDDTTVLDWLYLLPSGVFGADAVPELIVIGFAYRHLVDAPVRPVQTYRLGRFFTAWSDLPELFAEDVTSLDDRVNVIASKVSATFANRERLSARLLDLLPGYRASAQHVNETLAVAEGGTRTDAAAEYGTLRRLAKRVDEAGSRLIVVAMPTREDYELPPGLPAAAEAAGVELLDLRDATGLGREHFADSLHMNAAGARIYSEALGAALGPLLDATR